MTLQEFEQELEAAAQQMLASSCPSDRPDTIRGFQRYGNAVALLPASQRNKIADIARQIMASLSGATPVIQVTLVGHADRDLERERREPGFMLRISRDRAAIIMQALRNSLGPAIASKIKWIPDGVGARSLAVPNPRTEAERACNRRVEVALSHSCSTAQKEQVDLAEAAAVHFVRTALGERNPVPTFVDCFTPGKMPFVCDIAFSNSMVLQVEVSADHLRVLVSIADAKPNLIGRVCTYQYRCLPSGSFVFSAREGQCSP